MYVNHVLEYLVSGEVHYLRSRRPEEPSDNADEQQQQQQQQQQCVDVSSIEQQREELRVKLAAAEDRLQVTHSGGDRGYASPEPCLLPVFLLDRSRALEVGRGDIPLSSR